MIGYEIEIDLPVVDGKGAKIKGDTKLAASRTRTDGKPVFKVVADSRSLPDGRKYSNLEFVTRPWSVVGDGHTRGPAALLDTLTRIRTVRDAFYRNTTALLSAPADLLDVLPAGTGARLAGGNGYRESAGTEGRGDGLFVHYSVGVPVSGMATFFDRLRRAAPLRDGVYLPDARHRLQQANAFAERAVQEFLPRNRPNDAGRNAPALSARARRDREVLGYLQLVFMQITAFADHADTVARGGPDSGIKNRTVVLSRSPLADVHAHLDPEVRTALRTHHDALVTLLADDYQEEGRVRKDMGFYETAVREIDGGPVVLLDYATAAFRGDAAVPQQSVFGGMRQIAPHVEEEAVMVPFEIRTLGSSLKSWTQVEADLRDLCDWVQSSHELGMA
ncbi:hypothetical protein ACWC5I_21955 [Kitasatospora sp. NPDC001574]